MSNPTALSRFKPYGSGEGPLAENKEVLLKTNLAGTPISFSLNEDLSSIVSTASLTLLDAEMGEIGQTDGVVGGVPNPADDIASYGKEVPDSQVEPNAFVYVTEIIGDYTETDNGVNAVPRYTYTAVGTGQVCTTHWRITSATISTNENYIPVCEVSLESLSKIAQEIKINAEKMGSSDNAFIIIEKDYLDMVMFWHDDLSKENEYQSESWEELLEGFLKGGTTTTTTSTIPYPNGSVLVRYKSPMMRDGVNGIDGIADAQTELEAKGYSCGPPGIDGIFGPYTKAALLAYQTSVHVGYGGILGPTTWASLFPPTTTSVYHEPGIKIIVIEDYNTYCDIFFNRIKDAGFNFTGDFATIATGDSDLSLKTIPLNTTYHTGDNIWNIINDILSFNGLNIRFKRDKSLVIWNSSELSVIGEDYDAGEFGTGLSLTYSKEGVINVANVLGYIGILEDVQTKVFNKFTPPTQSGNGEAYPNKKVYLRYPYSPMMIDGRTFSGVTLQGIARMQTKLEAKGFDCGPPGIDGKYGPYTKAAVKRFQASVHISTDGVVGPVTWGKLFPVAISDNMTIKQVGTYLTGIEGITVNPADLTNTSIATLTWFTATYPLLPINDTEGQTGNITWSIFTNVLNSYIDTLNIKYNKKYWMPQGDKPTQVVAYHALADTILNISGYSENAVSGEFEVSADYLLMSEDALVKYGQNEIFKTIITARSGSYTNTSLPLSLEVGMSISGHSALVGSTTILISSLNRTTSVQEQQVSTSIGGNLVKYVAGGEYTWV